MIFLEHFQSRFDIIESQEREAVDFSHGAAFRKWSHQAEAEGKVEIEITS